MFWEKSNWESNGEHLTRVMEMPFRRELPKVEISKGLYVIRGPRQVGKSSWLKTLLSQTIQEHSGKDCFYESCEEIEDYRHRGGLQR